MIRGYLAAAEDTVPMDMGHLRGLGGKAWGKAAGKGRPGAGNGEPKGKGKGKGAKSKTKGKQKKDD